MLIKSYILIFVFILFSFWAKATHNRAGEITYEQTGELTISATVTTYTKRTSVSADRDSIFIEWGDGTSSFIKRTNGDGEDLGNNVQLNEYTATHTYPGRNTYKISMTDPNRVAEIQNVNYPNSETIKFHIFTEFTFTNSNLDGKNSSVKLLQRPIDFACVGQPFIHIPNAYDEDGDSIVFELSQPYIEGGAPVDDYQYPNEIIPDNNNFSFSTVDGTIIWETPQKAGEYNVTFLVKEYRKGILLNTMVRDMQIFVRTCNDIPPVLEVPEEICVVAGDIVEFQVIATDEDEFQQVRIEATGAPFSFSPNNAVFNAPLDYTDPPVIGTFTWQTRCEDISNNYYQIVFRAVDDFFISSDGQVKTGLADLKSVKIKVVGPAPQNLEAESKNKDITLQWDLPYACEETEDMFFQGFSIWRNNGSIDISIDTCSPGIDGKGYTRIKTPHINIENNKYTYIDKGLEKGKTYCYRVVPEFALISSAGHPYNFIQGLVSNEICLQLARDIPLLTEVSVIKTDISDGQIQTRWIKPLAQDLDTIKNPGPYRYQLQRAEGIDGTNFEDVTGASFTTTQFSDPVQTEFLDSNLNTIASGYNYNIAFYTDGTDNFYDFSPTSSSIYLTVKSSDEINILEWEENTSWINTEYFIYKFNDSNNVFEKIDSTSENEYIDTKLTNGTEYCYTIQSKGSYQTTGLSEILYNFSNSDCGIPLDTIPPCIPTLTLSNICDEVDDNTPEEDFVNSLEWNQIYFTCPNSDDVAAYHIYFKSSINNDYELIKTITDYEVINFDHKPPNGLIACYAISAIDSIGNESKLSDFLCINDCPSYILPNAFTPNNDGSNDLFVPILSRFVTRVNFQVFNEWGQKVFSTTNSMILWDGKNFQGNELNDGVYYYTCEVFQNSAEAGEQSYDYLKGYIQLLKSK